MAKTFHISIVTPEKTVFDGPVSYISVPGSGGYMGILIDHTPIIAALNPGRFELRLPEGAPLLFQTQRGGFLELVRNKMSILLDAADSDVLSMVSC